MSKSLNQIFNYLNKTNFKTERDWRGISFLVEDDFDFDTKSIQPKFDEGFGITFSDFGEWLDKGVGVGDVVVYQGKHYIVGNRTNESARFVATIQNNEILPLNQKDPSSVAMLSELELAPNDYTEYVRNLLAEKLLMFSYRTCDLIERYDPNAFDMVHFHGPGMEGIGVYKGKVGDGFQMCCYTLLGKDKTTKYSSSEIIPNYNSFVFWKTTTSEETKLRRRLEKFGKRWNKPCNRIEPVGYGDDINKCYFYITEAMEVKECTDTKERKFTERRKGGNVFRKKEDAVIILGLFRDIINKFLAEDQAE